MDRQDVGSVEVVKWLKRGWLVDPLPLREVLNASHLVLLEGVMSLRSGLSHRLGVGADPGFVPSARLELEHGSPFHTLRSSSLVLGYLTWAGAPAPVPFREGHQACPSSHQPPKLVQGCLSLPGGRPRLDLPELLGRCSGAIVACFSRPGRAAGSGHHNPLVHRFANYEGG